MMKGLRSINKEGKSKMFLTLMLLCYSIVVAVISHNIFIVAAMFCSTCGDVAIMSNRGVFNDTKYQNWDYGIVFFALAHILYMLAMRGKTYTAILVLIAIFAFLVILFVVFNMEAKEHMITNVAYAMCIMCNFINCCFNTNKIAIIAMGFFISSDIILILTEKKNPRYQIAIWITYVIAQILLITSVII